MGNSFNDRDKPELKKEITSLIYQYMGRVSWYKKADPTPKSAFVISFLTGSRGDYGAFREKMKKTEEELIKNITDFTMKNPAEEVDFKAPSVDEIAILKTYRYGNRIEMLVKFNGVCFMRQLKLKKFLAKSLKDFTIDRKILIVIPINPDFYRYKELAAVVSRMCEEKEQEYYFELCLEREEELANENKKNKSE